VAVAGGGLTAAATTSTTVSTASATASSPAPTPTATAPAAAAAAVPAVVPLWVRVPAANVWYRTGWVRRVDRPSLGATPHLERWVANQSVHQRLVLGTNLMTQALRGEQVVLLGTRGPWAHVRLPQQRGNFYRFGVIGWIWRSQLSASAVPSAAAPQLPRHGSSLIRAAAVYWHAPYIFGGMTRAGIDCSGLTYDAALRVGVVLPRDAADQSRVGTAVRRHALRPGDLVFFGSGGRSSIHHVGIYIGHGRILHAPHTGSSVRISALKSFPDYWGARRLVPSG
jgi:cell wall-associated NlpC family hydrolase